MNTLVFNRPREGDQHQKKGRPAAKLLVFTIATGALSAFIWWFFFGSKPKVVLTLAVPGAEVARMTGPGETAVAGGGKLRLVDLRARAERWAVPLPAARPVDAIAQAEIARRFVRLQIWAAELQRKRAALKTAAETKAFNTEAAKYAAELAAARADTARTQPPTPPPADTQPPGGDRSKLDKLNTVETEDKSIATARVKKREPEIAALRAKIEATRSVANLPKLKQAQLKEDTAKLKALEAAHTADTALLEADKPKAAPPEPPEDVPVKAFLDRLGPYIWAGAGNMLGGFDPASGASKIAIPLAGTMTHLIYGNEELYAIAASARGIRQITRITPNGASQSLYVEATTAPTGPEAPKLHHEFHGSGGFAVVEIRTLTPAPVDPDIAATPPPAGEEITIRRPFNTAAPEWKATFPEKVRIFSTPRLILIATATQLAALDPNNRQLWSHPLTAPVATEVATPAIEASDRLYFFDRAGLNALDIATGRNIWRLPGFGIQRVDYDDAGSLYAHSANLPTESPTPLGAHAIAANSILMKISPTDGSVEWTQPKYDDVWTSGTDLYALRLARDTDGLKSNGPAKIHKLSPSNGKSRWEWTQPHRPLQLMPDKKTVGVLFEGELQVIHSLAL